MEQLKKNKKELLDTIKRYNEIPINPELAAFLADCWGAYNALCLVCGGEEQTALTDDDVEPLSKEQAIGWVASMENADGKQGGHWSMEQTEQVRKQKGFDCNSAAFYAAMNMMYADYCKVAEKFNVNSPEFFMCMAKAFLDDKDAMPNKLARYYHSIAK